MNVVANWLMVAVAVTSLVLSVCIPILVGLFNSHKKTAKELSEHRTHVAEKYATKDDVKYLGDRMERQMKDGFNNIKEILMTHKDDV
ncbi:hypothetical protein [Shewanella marina]|uniref:hypothetical protein n=1 Tax=Shewanella marina TaxID=487319 RepID=UPI00046F70C0|nr:hypothetical protein [Shewanella marina]